MCLVGWYVFFHLYLNIYSMDSNIQEKFAKKKKNCFQNSMRHFKAYYTEFTAKFQYLTVKEMDTNN
jgi:hypothetical protein